MTDTITIELPREVAERWAGDEHLHLNEDSPISTACRTALTGESELRSAAGRSIRVFDDKNDELTANPSPPEEGEGWQPIETAPKTAERFHAWESYPEWPAPHGRVITAWWQAFGDDQGWQDDNVHAPVAGTLTHWMPLPAPPTEGGEGE